MESDSRTVMAFLLSVRLCSSSDFLLPSVTGISIEEGILKSDLEPAQRQAVGGYTG